MFINLREHDVNIIHGDKVTRIPPSGNIALLQYKTEEEGTVEGVPCVYDKEVRVHGLPPEIPGIVLIVSRRIFDFCPERKDLAVPDMNTSVRNHKKELLGVQRLIMRK